MQSPVTPPTIFPHVPAGTGHAYNVIGTVLTVKLTSAETGGRFAVLELRTPPKGGPPLHTHRSAADGDGDRADDRHRRETRHCVPRPAARPLDGVLTPRRNIGCLAAFR